MAEHLSDFRAKLKCRPSPRNRRQCPYSVNYIPMSQRASSKTYSRLIGAIYGQVVADAIGHLTESLSKEQAIKIYGTVQKEMELVHKKLLQDGTRRKWSIGDWTEESDLMLIILQSLTNCRGQVDLGDLTKRFMDWNERGIPEMNDICGQGLDKYTKSVITHPQFSESPKHAASICWRNTCSPLCPSNNAVARTSVLGIHYYNAHGKIIHNAIEVCSLTHPDPRCLASCVAVVTAISLMMQEKHLKKNGHIDVDEVIDESYRYASRCLLDRPTEEFKSLKRHMTETSLKNLKLGDISTMGHTFKAVGAGFWALKQKDFRTAIQHIVMEGGDSDANAAVAGALLGCKLGYSSIPQSWVDGLRYKGWLDDLVNRYLNLMERGKALPKSESTV